MSCPHCNFMEELFKEDDIKNNREYWIMTEVFVYLHDGKDYCDYGRHKKPMTLNQAMKEMAEFCKDKSAVIKRRGSNE